MISYLTSVLRDLTARHSSNLCSPARCDGQQAGYNASAVAVGCPSHLFVFLQVVLLSGFTLIRPNIPPWYIGKLHHARISPSTYALPPS